MGLVKIKSESSPVVYVAIVTFASSEVLVGFSSKQERALIVSEETLDFLSKFIFDAYRKTYDLPIYEEVEAEFIQ